MNAGPSRPSSECMATIFPADLTHSELARIFRAPRCYAPDHVIALLQPIVDVRELALLIDVDALERSALARIDRVMQFAFTALSRVATKVFFAARYERERSLVLQRAIPDSRFASRSAALALPLIRENVASSCPLIVLSDDPPVFDALPPKDRGLALGRPELARANITALADTSVRATLWWLFEERARALAS
jgi:hypothetical protein